MARFKDREKVLELRKQQLSYNQIKEIIGVSKGTLSVWLKDFPLSRERINELRARNEGRIEKFRGTMQKKRQKRLAEIYENQKNRLLPLSRREILIAGLFLYLGEGAKTKSETSLSNTNPETIKFFLYWLTEIYKVPRVKIKVRLQLYHDMHINDEIEYWMKALQLDRQHFATPYIKKSNKQRINHHGGFGHGTCNIIAPGVPLFEEITMSIKVILNDVLTYFS